MSCLHVPQSLHYAGLRGVAVPGLTDSSLPCKRLLARTERWHQGEAQKDSMRCEHGARTLNLWVGCLPSGWLRPRWPNLWRYVDCIQILGVPSLPCQLTPPQRQRLLPFAGCPRGEVPGQTDACPALPVACCWYKLLAAQHSVAWGRLHFGRNRIFKINFEPKSLLVALQWDSVCWESGTFQSYHRTKWRGNRWL